MRYLLIFTCLLISYNSFCQDSEDINEYVLNIDTSGNNYSRGRIKDLTFFIQMSPDNYRYYFERGYLFLMLKDYDNAMGDIEKAYKLNSQDSALQTTRQKLYAIKNVLTWVQSKIESTDKFEPIQFDEFFIQNYSEELKEFLKTKSEITYSIVFNYKINESLVTGKYYHLDSSLNVVAEMTFSEMIKFTLAVLPTEK